MRRGKLPFWLTYALSCVASHFVVIEVFYIVRSGRLPDDSARVLYVLGTLATTIIVAICYKDYFRDLRYRVLLACVLGLFSFVPAVVFVALLRLFITIFGALT